MIHGELSNQVGYVFGFRCEDFLIHFKNSSLLDKVLNTFLDKAGRAEVDGEVSSLMEYIYRHTEYTVDLLIERSNYTNTMKLLLEEVPYNRIVLVDKPSQISSRLLMGDLTYYVDDDAERRSLVNSKYAITLKQLQQELKRSKR